MKRLATTLSVMIGSAALFAAPASADYMGRCDKLISEWKTCISTTGSCAREEATIRKKCKCHALKGNEWKLVMAAVAESNVCGNEDPPTIEIPPPSEPPRLHHDPRNNGAGGAGAGGGENRGDNNKG